MNHAAHAATDRWREGLVLRGFTDDGERLRGSVPWSAPGAGAYTAWVEITPGPAFPIAPPRVVVLDAGAPLELTFHVERSGALCLWEDEWSVDEAPWCDPDSMLARISEWLELTAAGWPGDDSCDLERYLEQDLGAFVLYDASVLVLNTPVRTRLTAPSGAWVITDERWKVRQLNGGRPRRRDARLAWVTDIGVIARPLRGWDDVATALGGRRAAEVTRLIDLGCVTLLLLRYRHGDASGSLALHVRRTGCGIELTACESADMSPATRGLRAGPSADELSNVRVAVMGCGAIGSFAADLLFRSGVRRLTLADGERLRPGNVVRHLGGLDQVGCWKTEVVRACLAGVDPDTTQVETRGPLLDLEDARALLKKHHVVLDATGNARASGLLAVAADELGSGTGHAVVSVCSQRAGNVVRVDRMPLRGGEAHLPPLSLVDDADHARELGCGSPVSPTPPSAVVAAAELAHRVVVDEATRACLLPATVAEVRTPQAEAPFDRIGHVTSANPPQAAAS